VFLVAGRAVRVRADAALAPWLAPLCRREAYETTVDLEIDLRLGPCAAAATRIESADGGRVVAIDQPGVSLTFDRRARRIDGFVEPDALPRWERAKPLGVALTIWASDLGLLALHAGLVARDGAGVLFAGPSGSGKSTCALACGAAGFEFLADDFVLADPASGWRAHSVFAAAALDARGLARLAADSTAPDAAAGDKAIVMAGHAAMPRVGTSAQPVALVLPRLGGAEPTRLRRATKAEALARLAPSSILRRAVPATHNLRQLAALTAALPTYWLEMRHGPHEIPPVVAGLIEEAACARPR
jgi:hypothetical protein